MKQGSFKNECDSVEGLTKEQAEIFVADKLLYPYFRVLFVTIENQLMLVIETHMVELGEDSDFFSLSCEAYNFSDIPDNEFEIILGPMINRLNIDMGFCILEQIAEDHLKKTNT